MKRKKNTKKYLVLFPFALLFGGLTLFFFFKNISTKKLLDEKPTEIIVTNISTVEAQIYWKSNQDNLHRIYYKKTTDAGLYKEIYEPLIYFDFTSNQLIYTAKIENLEPNTEYLFRIESENNMWDSGYSFKTKDIAEEVTLPVITTGTDDVQSFLLIETNNDKYIVNTQYHGTWALDTKGEDYSVSNYASYISQTQLQSKLNNLLSSPIYATSGANCKTNIGINNSSYSPSKSKTVDILNRWVDNCKSGGYPDECYEDVYCRSVKAGVDPAFTIAIWSNESGGSNYAHNSSVEDFGIHGLSSIPNANFDKQIDHFLNNIASTSDSYIAECKNNGDVNKINLWGARFLTGNCSTDSDIAKGKEYMTGISEIYSWYTNKSLSWPFTISSDSSACDYSSAYTNNTYNSCTAKGTPTSSATSSTTPTTTTKGGDGSKDYMIVTGTGVTPVDRDCEDPDGCICLYGYTDSKAQSTLTTNNGYTCTIDKRVIVTPDIQKVCCFSNNSLSYVLQTACNGSIISDIEEKSCKSESNTISLKKGVNFIEAKYILNVEEVPVNTAKSLISYSNNKILAVGSFRNDIWERIVKNENGTINGEDFNLQPGESYLVITTEEIQIPVIVAVNQSTIELQSLTGWNLIPSSIFKNVSSNSKSLLENTEYTYINQVALWSDTNSMFNYTLRDNFGEIYGDSLNMLDQEGFFIKISQ